MSGSGLRRGRTAGVFSALALGAAPALGGLQWTEQQSTRFPQPALTEYTNQVAMGDVDGDGDLDLAFANGGGFISAGSPQQQRLFINNGSGVFSDGSIARGMPIGLCRDVQFVDIDNDDDLDMVFAQDFARKVIVLVNDGTGHFTDESDARRPAANLGSPHLSAGDVDNDGDLDLVIGNGGSSRWGTAFTHMWLNDGNGVFTNATSTNLPAVSVQEPMDVVFADVDNDLDLDVMVGSHTPNHKLFINGGAGVYSDATATNLPAGSQLTYSFDFADFDNDNDLDCVGINNGTSSRETMWANNGAGVFANVTSTAIPTASNPSVDDNDSKFIDWDYDGDMDMLIGSLGSTERALRNNGDSTYTLQTGTIQAVADSTLDIEVGDLDGDGDLDVVTAQGESGSFVNKIYMNVEGPADGRAPTVSRLETLVNTRKANAGRPVRARIRDDNSSDQGPWLDSVTLHYSVNGGGTQDQVMRWAGHDSYRGVLPAAPCGSSVEYWVSAVDRTLNAGPDSSHVVYLVLGPADADGDGDVDFDDLNVLLAAWGTTVPPGTSGDADNDGDIDFADLNTVLVGFGGNGCV